MRVLHINATSHTGGAARAMQRLHTALLERGHQSQFLVGRTRCPEDPTVHLIWDEVAGFRSFPDRLKSRVGNQLERYIGIHPWANRTNLHITDTDLYRWADVIDLRNLFGRYFNLWCLPALSADKPVVWRMPDLWAVTGHCAYPYDCQRWKTGCYHCPLLTGTGRQKVEPAPTVWDGTRRVWKAKRDIYTRSRLHVIVTTRWMKEQVQDSILADALSISVISNGVNLETFKPVEKSQARRLLDLPGEETLLLWAAGGKGNYRKGYHLAVQAMKALQMADPGAPALVTMGEDEGWNQPESLLKVHHLGYVRDSAIQALVYSAVDAFLCTTLADGQPQTALESLACGTPLIAFDLGPMPDLAIPGKTGYLARKPTAEELMQAINEFLDEPHPRERLRENCRREALDKYDLGKQTERYIELYQSLLEKTK
jgi:glycosyltransferase involved in cell wall biosynthesis